MAPGRCLEIHDQAFEGIRLLAIRIDSSPRKKACRVYNAAGWGPWARVMPGRQLKSSPAKEVRRGSIKGWIRSNDSIHFQW
jgi:hypothetical protein